MSAPLALLASAPTRLDFGGGWTDVPPYPQERGGFVCAVAIERRATVTLRLHALAGVEGSAGGNVKGKASANSTADTSTDAAAKTAPDALVRAALRRANAEHLHVSLRSDFPVGAGLGGSSAAGVALAAGLAAWQQRVLSLDDLAETSRDTEVNELGIAGGRQDHYAAAYGGALGLRFGEVVEVHRITLSDATRADLEARCLLVYTGESRISGTTIRAVLDAYRERNPHVVLSLDRMASLAQLMATALAHADLESLGALVGEHWVHQRELHAGIPTPRIDTLISRALGAGALGAKPLGASGGGCVLIICARDRAPDVTRAIHGLGEVLPFRIATHGALVQAIE